MLAKRYERCQSCVYLAGDRDFLHGFSKLVSSVSIVSLVSTVCDTVCVCTQLCVYECLLWGVHVSGRVCVCMCVYVCVCVHVRVRVCVISVVTG